MIRRPPRSTLSLHDALPISTQRADEVTRTVAAQAQRLSELQNQVPEAERRLQQVREVQASTETELANADRKSTRLNSSHANISYAVFCLKKKNRGVLTRDQE